MKEISDWTTNQKENLEYVKTKLRTDLSNATLDKIPVPRPVSEVLDLMSWEAMYPANKEFVERCRAIRIILNEKIDSRIPHCKTCKGWNPPCPCRCHHRRKSILK